ncbi:MAG: DNA polymerase III subunit beta [Sphaerochaetaceae bacterium]|jgi:DNA polymerase-3 subunit beta|nr:DNA polymerase III subunit beta [Sphaerochaetaceae bacterium]MDX9938849.1 DNA polymerase III subunit beta [Sphaerochaetaceae bacterium]
MKFACQKNTLLREIVLALDFTSQRNTLSIVSNVLLETYGNTLVIKATDQKVGFSSTIPVETIEEGSTTVFCDKFLGILRTLPDENIIFEELGDKLFIHPEKKSIDFELRTIAADKYPALEDAAKHEYFALSQKDLFDMIDQTIFAISDDETRYFMNGVYLEQESDGLVMVATDGRRLSYIKRKLDQAVPSFTPVIIPAKFLTLLKKAGTGEGQIFLSVSESVIFAKFGSQFMYSTLIKGQFPNYRRVIPASQSNTCKLSIAEMNEALKRVSLLVENKAKRMYLDIEAGGITISSEESDFGQAKEIIRCDYAGDPCRLAMNYSYLVSPLRVMEGDSCAICFTESNKAVTVKPDPEKDYFHIIMPMQID